MPPPVVGGIIRLLPPCQGADGVPCSPFPPSVSFSLLLHICLSVDVKSKLRLVFSTVFSSVRVLLIWCRKRGTPPLCLVSHPVYVSRTGFSTVAKALNRPRPSVLFFTLFSSLLLADVRSAGCCYSPLPLCLLTVSLPSLPSLTPPHLVISF